MKKKEVQVGKAYVVKVSGKLTHVRIDSIREAGGWFGTNLNTGKKVTIKSAQRLRLESLPPSTNKPLVLRGKGYDLYIPPSVQRVLNG